MEAGQSGSSVVIGAGTSFTCLSTMLTKSGPSKTVRPVIKQCSVQPRL